MEQHTNGEDREVSGSLKDLDAAALQARMEKAERDPCENEDGPGNPSADVPPEKGDPIRRTAKRQLWLIAVCVLLVVAGAAALSLRFGNLFSGGKTADKTIALTSKEAPWLSFSDGMLSYNGDYTGDVPASITIPDTFDGKTVEGIADEGFVHLEEITELIMGREVSKVGVRAFEGCSNLVRMDLGGVQEISYGAFDGCTSLTDVAAEEIIHIGAYAFQDCRLLAAFPFGEGIASIGACAFQNCGDMRISLTLSASASKIGQNAFENCTALLQIVIPDADSIGASAFQGCTSVTRAEINCLNVGDRALAECSALESAAFGGKTLTLGKELFAGCTLLTEVTYENEGTTLSEGVFLDCVSLQTPPLPAGVSEIPPRLFAGCTALGDTGISSRILHIGDGAYEGCSALTQAYIPNNTETLGKGVFAGCTALTEYTLPSDTVSIPARFFSGCAGLVNASIPEGIQSVEEGAFENCTGLLHANIPYGTHSLGNSAFAGCTALQKLTLPASMQSIGENAFQGCSAVQYLDVPKSVTFIGDGAFADMGKLQSLGLFASAQVTAGMFAGCSALSDIRTSGYDSLYSVSSGVLFSADGETLILYPGGLGNQNYTVPAKVNKIEAGAFRGSKLKNLHTGTTALIGMYAFADCPALQSVTLGEGLTEMGYGAFEGCAALEKVQLPHTLSALDSKVFAGCTSLAKLILPVEVTRIAADSVEKTTTLCVEENAPILEALERMELTFTVSKKKS